MSGDVARIITPTPGSAAAMAAELLSNAIDEAIRPLIEAMPDELRARAVIIGICAADATGHTAWWIDEQHPEEAGHRAAIDEALAAVLVICEHTGLPAPTITLPDGTVYAEDL